MTSDDKKDNDLELENADTNDVPAEDDVIDLEVDTAPMHEQADDDITVEEADMSDDDPMGSLSATSFSDLDDEYGDDLDVDITGDADVDFADEDDDLEYTGAKSGGLKKIVAPALVLVIAAGVGGYIVMNPQILGGGNDVLPQPVNPYVAQAPAGDNQMSGFDAAPEQQAMPAVTDLTEQASTEDQGSDMFATDLPQPTVNQNEMPRPPEDFAAEGEGFGGNGFGDTESAAPIELTEMDAPQPPEMPMAEETPAESVPESTEAEALENELAALKMAAEQEDITIIDPEPVQSAEERPALEEPATEEVVVVEEPEAASVEDFPVMEQGSTMSEESDVAEAPAESGLIPMAGDAKVVEVGDETMPEKDTFVVAQAETPKEPVAEAKPAATKSVSMDAAAGTSSSPVATSQTMAPASDTFYDGRVPTGPLKDTVGPRKVDPVMEPASQMVVVKKAYEETDMEALLVSANRALKLKRYDSALEMFNQLYEKNPRDQRILMGRAVALQNTGSVDAAIRAYEGLLDINPKNADAMLNMLGLLRQQYPEVALRRLMVLRDKYPNSAGIAAQIGVTQADLGYNDDAMRYLGTAASLDPTNAQHFFNMAVISDRSGKTQNAIKYYEQALETDAVYGSGRTINREVIYDRLSTLRRR